MVVTCWGVKLGKDCISSMPIWIKLTDIPDSYWTEEGLNRLASVVGKPLGADNLTSKLEMLPYAKIQGLYKLGDPLPNEVAATVLDPVTEQKYVAKVNIVYPFRSLFCSGCRFLGHSVGPCPSVTIIWVKKDAQGETTTPDVTNNQQEPVIILEPGDCATGDKGQESNTGFTENGANDWTKVKRRNKGALGSPDVSPTPPCTFKNLKVVDEVDIRKEMLLVNDLGLTRSQKKKLRHLKGGSPLILGS